MSSIVIRKGIVYEGRHHNGLHKTRTHQPPGRHERDPTIQPHWLDQLTGGLTRPD